MTSTTAAAAPDAYRGTDRLIFGIVLAVVSSLLLRGTPESKVESALESSFDWYGFAAFIVAMVAVNIVIGQGVALGWLNPVIVALALVQQGAGPSSLLSGLLTVGVSV